MCVYMTYNTVVSVDGEPASSYSLRRKTRDSFTVTVIRGLYSFLIDSESVFHTDRIGTKSEFGQEAIDPFCGMPVVYAALRVC